jgi:hypothetical protein
MPVVPLGVAQSNLHWGIQIWMVAGFAEVAVKKDNLVAEACNHPNCLGLAFRSRVTDGRFRVTDQPEVGKAGQDKCVSRTDSHGPLGFITFYVYVLSL